MKNINATSFWGGLILGVIVTALVAYLINASSALSLAEEEKTLTKEEKEIQEANELKEKLESSIFTIKHKVGANGHLIGSVTNKEIAQTLQDNDINIDKKQIVVKSKIKTIGIFEVDCKLGHGVHATALIDIIQEK